MASMSRMIHFFFDIEDCTECISSDFSTIIDRRLPRRCLRRDIEMNVAFHTLSDISWYAWNFDTAVHPRDSITARLKEIVIDTLNKFYATIGEVESTWILFFLFLFFFCLFKQFQSPLKFLFFFYITSYANNST